MIKRMVSHQFSKLEGGAELSGLRKNSGQYVNIDGFVQESDFYNKR